MNKAATIVASLAAGAIAGFFSGAFFMKKKMDDVVDQLVDEEVAKFVDEVSKRKAEKDDVIDESIETLTNKENQPEPFDHYNSLNGPNDTYHKPDPTKLFNNPVEEHPQEPDEETDILEENPVKKIKEDDDMKDPKLISEDKFDSETDFEKETLYYYNEDDVLTTEDEEEIVNEYEYVGDALDKFDFRTNDEQCVHVRNFEMRKDFEVLKVFAAFR